METVELTIFDGQRLWFTISTGGSNRFFHSAHLNNKERVMVRLIKDLKWSIKFDEEDTSDLYRHSQVLEADVDEGLASALKALMRMRGLRRGELERLMSLPSKEACEEIIRLFLVNG